MSEKSKTRVRFTLPGSYVEALDSLIEKGIYRDRSDVILDALRASFREKGIEPFSEEPV